MFPLTPCQISTFHTPKKKTKQEKHKHKKLKDVFTWFVMLKKAKKVKSTSGQGLNTAGDCFIFRQHSRGYSTGLPATWRFQVHILLPATKWICVWWPQIQLFHILQMTEQSASLQMGFLRRFWFFLLYLFLHFLFPF